MNVREAFIELKFAIALGTEQDIASIGRPAWSPVVCLAVDTLDHIVNIRVYDIVFIMNSIMR